MRSSAIGLAMACLACGASTEPRLDAGSEPDARAPDARADEVTYEVINFATALERFAIVARHPARRVCVGVLFVWPSTATPGVSLPPDWAVQTAFRNPIDRCGADPFGTAPETETASSISGVGEWPDDRCVVGVDVTLRFEDGTEERLHVEDLATSFWGC